MKPRWQDKFLTRKEAKTMLINSTKLINPVKAITLAALTVLVSSCSAPSTPSIPDPFASPAENVTGVPPLSGQLERSKLTMTSVISVDLDRNIARVPLFRGSYNGTSVWYVRMDVSDAGLARELGLNFAPRLANAANGCPACVQSVTSADPVLGGAPAAFAGTVDFSPERVIVPSATGFPPLTAQPGSVAGPGYSDLVRVEGSGARPRPRTRHQDRPAACVQAGNYSYLRG